MAAVKHSHFTPRCEALTLLDASLLHDCCMVVTLPLHGRCMTATWSLHGGYMVVVWRYMAITCECQPSLQVEAWEAKESVAPGAGDAGSPLPLVHREPYLVRIERPRQHAREGCEARVSAPKC